MKELILYFGTFIISYLFYVTFVICRKSVIKKFPEGKEASYLKYKYGVKIDDKNLKSIANKICLVNSFILSTTVYVVCLFDSLILELLVGFVTLVALILSSYHLLGVYYKKKQGGK